MKNVLQREFLLIDVNGETQFTGNLVELFNKLRFRFIESVGLEMSVHTVKDIDVRWLSNEYSVRHVYKYKVSSSEYVIRDGFGRKYCPKFLMSVLEEHRPKLVESFVSRELYRRGLIHWHNYWAFNGRNKHKRPNVYNKHHVRLMKQNENSVEEYGKPIRKVKDYYSGYYDDYYYRPLQRNWKQFRSEQYKVK